MEFRELIKRAAKALQIDEYGNFIELVETEQITNATDQLTGIRTCLMESTDDDSLDQFNLVSSLLDDWLKFTESEGAGQVAANYAAERRWMYGG
jgi:hypothetical protein